MRPVAKSARSTSSSSPLFSRRRTQSGSSSTTSATESAVTTRRPKSSICIFSRSPISWSRNGSSRSCPEIRATFTPSARNIVAYSHPITPAPTTASDFGIRSIRKMVSLS